MAAPGRVESEVGERLEPRFAEVYGADHSPWVQAVLLGLFERGVSVRLRSVPPRAIAFDTGIFMPAVRFDGEGPWLYDSAAILERLGFDAAPAADVRAMQAVFMGGALPRIDSPLAFFGAWARMRIEGSSALERALHHVVRAFVPFYFFFVINMARRSVRRRDAELLQRDFEVWEERLARGGPFLGGVEPGVADLQLFGQVQMLASIPGPSLEVIRVAPGLERLRAWIAHCQHRWIQFPHLYSAAFFEPAASPPVESAFPSRLLFWSGVAILLLALPLSLAVALWLAIRVERKGLRGGGARSAAAGSASRGERGT